MYVNRLRLYGVKSLRRDIPSDGEFAEPAHRRLLLQGANGAGKTTILETIVSLWAFFGQWIENGRGSRPPKYHTRHYLAKAELAAVEFCDFANGLPSLWVGMGNANSWQDLKREHGESQFAGLLNFGREKWSIELPDVDLAAVRAESIIGRVPQANVVYFPPENRTIAPLSLGSVRLLNMQDFSWATIYGADIDPDSLLLTIKATDPTQYKRCLELVNLALAHRAKEILAVRGTERHAVQIRIDGKPPLSHLLDALSSGEKQLLLLVGFVVCVLRPGGIVLIDEPDLHMHISLVTQLMETIERIVHDRNGQLIVASHSQLVWDWFVRDEERIDLTAWGQAKP